MAFGAESITQSFPTAPGRAKIWMQGWLNDTFASTGVGAGWVQMQVTVLYAGSVVDSESTRLVYHQTSSARDSLYFNGSVPLGYSLDVGTYTFRIGLAAMAWGGQSVTLNAPTQLVAVRIDSGSTATNPPPPAGGSGGGGSCANSWSCAKADPPFDSTTSALIQVIPVVVVIGVVGALVAVFRVRKGPRP